jgi:hypothetical protein
MAVFSICGNLKNGQDASCNAPARRFFQQSVVINFGDIARDSIVIDVPSEGDLECSYNVQFSLKDGKTGYRFTGPEAGSTYKGYFDKSNADLGFVQYKHNAQILIVGSKEDAKCIIDSLSKGKYVVAYQFTDGTVEIYGLQNGLTTADFTYDVQEGGGGTAIVLSSLETAPESLVPLVYKSLVPGSETADFDSNFSNIAIPISI